MVPITGFPMNAIFLSVKYLTVFFGVSSYRFPLKCFFGCHNLWGNSGTALLRQL